jgi:hypothetical protein
MTGKDVLFIALGVAIGYLVLPMAFAYIGGAKRG